MITITTAEPQGRHRMVADLNDPTPGGLAPSQLDLRADDKRQLYAFLALAVQAYAGRAGIHPGVVQYSLRFEDVVTPTPATQETPA